MKIGKLLCSAVVLAVVASPALSQTYVGSYWVGAGPLWSGSPTPPVYTAKEAAALLFGGLASDYIISTDQFTITGTAWVDGWGDTSHLKHDWFQVTGTDFGTAVDDDYSLGDSAGLYNPPAFSAYVGDHDFFNTTAASADASINYVFRISSNVPEPASWAMFIGGFGLVGSAMRRRKTSVRFA